MSPSAIQRVILFMLLFVAALEIPLIGVNQRQIVLNSQQAAFLDVDGTPLKLGELKQNTDGDLIQLGYFSEASTSNLFQGDWVPLTAGLYFGDSSTLSGGNPGQFQVSILFLDGSDIVTVYPDAAGSFQTQASHIITSSAPKGSPGQLLAIRYFDRNTISEGVRYNTIADSSWKWEPLSDQLGFPTIIAIDTQSTALEFQDPDNPYTASIKKNITAEHLPVYTVAGNILQGSGTIHGYGKYEEGTDATLIATPEIGYNFIAWTGDVSSSESTITTTVTSSLEVNAEFQIRTFDFEAIVSPENSGTVQGTGTYNYNETVELTAIPETGQKFLYWEIDDEQITDTTISLNATRNYSVYAVFEPLFYSLTLLHSPKSGGSTSGSGTFTYGSVREIVATPAEGYQFNKWQGGTVDNPDSATTSLSLTTDVTLTAVFSLIPDPSHEVEVIQLPDEGGTITGGGIYDHGTQATLTATPTEDYFFERWQDEEGGSSFDNPLEILVDKRIQRTAVFTKRPFRIEASGDFEKEFFPPDGTGTFVSGDQVLLTAFPADNWELSHWETTGEMEFAVRSLPRLDESGLTLYVDDLQQRELRLVRGGTYHFMVSDVSMSEQPFYISTNDQADLSGNFEGEFTENVINSRATTGLLTLSVDDDTPDMLYYHSGGTAGTGGLIRVYDPEELLSSPNENPTVLNGLADVAIVANYRLQHYELSAISFPSYGGVINGTGEFEWGSEVSISAVPNANYTFIGWNGVPEGAENSNPISITIDEATTVTANFSYLGPATHELAIEVNPPSSGSVSGAGAINHATRAIVSAVPAPGYRFVSWSGFSVEEADSATTDTQLVLSDTVLTANFELIPVFALHATYNPPNAGLLFGAGNYQAGSNVTVIALPYSEYVFTGWTGSELIADPSSSTTQITISEDTTLTANFNFIGTDTFDLVLNASPSNGGTLSGAGTYDKGKQVSIDASPNPGWVFTSWSGGEVNDANSSETSFQLLADTTLTANFIFVGLPEYTLTIQQNPLEGGTVTGSGEYEEGTEASIMAVPNSGYEFIGWTGGVPESPEEAETSITIFSDTTLIANYQFLGVGNTLSITSSPQEGGTTTGAGNYAADSHVSVTAVAQPGYKFVGWTGGNVDSPEQTETQVTLSSNIELVANFETLEEYTVSVLANPTLAASVIGSGSYLEGTTVSLEVIPAEGYSFIGWSGIELLDSTDPNPQFTLETDTTIFANLQYSGPTTHSLALSSNIESGAILKGAGNYGHGASVLIEAIVQKGYKFTHWSDTQGSSLPENPARVNMRSEMTLTAHLEEIIITSINQDFDLTWLESSWLGAFFKSNNNWLFTLNHGWVYPVGDSDDSVWLATPEGDWLWTSNNSYPWIYKEDESIWYYYSPHASSVEKSYYYNSTLERWLNFSPPQLP